MPTSTTYKVLLLGIEQEVSGWDPEGNLVLVDGSRFRFEPLFKNEADPRGHKLIKVLPITRTSEGWRINGLPVTHEECQRLYGLGQKADLDLVLQLFLWSEDPDNSNLSIVEAVAVAWFEGLLDYNDTAKPVFLRAFHAMESATCFRPYQEAKTSMISAIATQVSDIHKQVPTLVQSAGTAEKKLDGIRTDTATLKELAGERSILPDAWSSNPLGSREASADFILQMRSVGVNGTVTMQICRFGYGFTIEECAKEAGVARSTFKRALEKARTTVYAEFLSRTRAQKLTTRKANKELDKFLSRFRQMAMKDPETLRSMIDQYSKEPPTDGGEGNHVDENLVSEA